MHSDVPENIMLEVQHRHKMEQNWPSCAGDNEGVLRH